MALQPIQNAETRYWSLNGVTTGGAAADLGRFFFQVGAHYIGFDDSFEEPVFAQIYYDPADLEAALRTYSPNDYWYAGYMLFVQARFRGQPVPPQAYGGHFADRGPYADSENCFVDFMGPAQAAIHPNTIDGQDRPLYPFYAWNSALFQTITRWEQLTKFGRNNGVLYSPLGVNVVPANEQAHCASLIAEISPGFLTESVIDRLVSQGDSFEPIAVPPRNPPDLREPYEVAFDTLLSPRQITYPMLAGRAIGRYQLLTLPNFELMNPTLCVWGETGPNETRRVRARLIDWHELDSATRSEQAHALIRLYEATQSQNVMTDQPNLGVNAGRGAGGLDSPPIPLAANDLVLRYTASLCIQNKFARRTRSAGDDFEIREVESIRWDSAYTYDRVRGGFHFELVTPPQRVGFDIAPPLASYSGEINRVLQLPESQRPDIDFSNFTLASMRRNNMASGIKLRSDAAR